jgi:hypothetical protein
MWGIPEKRTTVIALFSETSTFTPRLEVKEQLALQKLLLTAFAVI